MQDTSHYLKTKPFLWLWVPLGFLVAQILAELFLPAATLSTINNENGVIELLQAALVGAGFIIAVMILWQGRKTLTWPLKIWMGLAALCCLYVTGEELSWGQHMFEWHTPEEWKAINDQQETNLHNTSSWLDQKPRLILIIGTVTGGILIPLAMRFKPDLLPQQFNIIYPEPQFWLTAVLTLVVKGIDKISSTTGIVFFERASEIEENYLFYFVLLYLLLMKSRLSPQR